MTWPPPAWHEHHEQRRQRFQRGTKHHIGDRVIVHSLRYTDDRTLERIQVGGVIRTLETEFHAYGVELDNGYTAVFAGSLIDPATTDQPTLF